MIVCLNVHQRKTSCYDKNAPTQWKESESAAYVKVKLIVDSLSQLKTETE